MPIVTEETQRKRRRPPWWALALLLAALLVVGVFAWSLVEPVYVRFGPDRRFMFGAMWGDHSSLGPGWHRTPNFWELVIELPGRRGLYHVSWVEPRKGR